MRLPQVWPLVYSISLFVLLWPPAEASRSYDQDRQYKDSFISLINSKLTRTTPPSERSASFELPYSSADSGQTRFTRPPQATNLAIKQLFLQYLAQKAGNQQQPQASNQPLASLATSSSEEDRQDFTQNVFDSSNESMETQLDEQLMSPSEAPLKPYRIHTASLPTMEATTTMERKPMQVSPLRIPLNLSSSSQRIAQIFKELNRNSKSYFNQPTNRSELICGDTVTISTNYEISSPNYPNKYPPNVDCTWDIQADKDQILRIQIFKLSIEHDTNCRFDYLDIRGVQQVNKQTGKVQRNTKRFCGNYLKGKEFDIGTNHTTIVFHSDMSNELYGFHLRIIAESQDCISDIFVHNTSYVTSPKYPQSYDDSKNCWTQLVTRPDHRLLVDFEDLYLEQDTNCSFDYVEIFDGNVSYPDKSFGRFCNLPPESKVLLHSTRNSMLFHFESDNFISLRGYKARVTALRQDVNMSNYLHCNWSADWANMTIHSPFYPKPYPANTMCETSISAYSPDERIIILFDWIDLVDELVSVESTTMYRENNAFRVNCTLDRLEIYESINDSRPSNVFCGYWAQPFKYVSKSNSIRLVFKSASGGEDHTHDRPRTSGSENLNNPGFRARFTFISTKEIDQASKQDGNKHLNDVQMHKEKSGTTLSEVPTTVLPVLIRKPENASVMLGSSHILHCEVENPDPSHSTPIIWFKGDREIHDGVAPDGTSLLIRQFRTQSVGRYICVYGDNSSDAWLTLKEDTPTCSSSAVLFRERPKDQYTSEGEFVMLHCSVTLANSGAEEDAEISWEKIPLHYMEEENQAEAQPVEFGNSRIKKLRRGDLLFDPALIEDSGFYFCVVRLRASPVGESEFMERLVANNQTLLSEKELQEINNRNANQDCVLKSAARVQINQRVDISQYCGRTRAHKHHEPTSPGEVSKIIGGSEAEKGEFPWMVMFWDEKRHVFCGGALLNERWAVTAAHCFTDILDESTVFVKLGKFDQTESESNEIVTKIQHIIKHPHFSNETFDNDIALVKLVKHITFTDYILPICIPTSPEEVQLINSYFFAQDPQEEEELSETKYGYVTGWGRLKENGPLPRYLHKIRLPIVNQAKCHMSTSFKVTENMFCAGYGKEIVGDACKGDSGGPFAVLFENRWTLLGIVSWGEGCGRPEKYGYYTKVNNYDNWIRKLTRLTY